ncbi:MAG TPA: glycosyltransferase family 4 protein [Solirubrobacteraceae bacterium]
MTTRWPAAAAPIAPAAMLPPQPARPRVKVLHVVTKFTDGAGGNTLLSVLGADPARYEMWVAGCPGGPLWERAERRGVKTVRLRHLREAISPVDDLIVLYELVRLIRRERFAVVHTHSSVAGFLGRLAAWIARTPVIVHTIHGFPYHAYMSHGRRRVYVAFERLVSPMTDAFLAVAPQVAREAVEMRLVRPGSISVVPSAVELDEIPRGADPGTRDALGLPADAPVVGAVGRLDFQKAPLDFVRMAALVAESHPDARFVMVGDGKLADDARAEARRLGVDVVFTGVQPDAARIAAGFDVYVVSSLYEGLGRALTEALASGRPVAATAVNGVVDMVEPGSTGLLSPPADPEALARNVAWLLDHPEEARRMGRAGQARARALFEPAVMCELIQETYARLLGLPEIAPAPSEPIVRVEVPVADNEVLSVVGGDRVVW